jgi:hypothetical protein
MKKKKFHFKPVAIAVSLILGSAMLVSSTVKAVDPTPTPYPSMVDPNLQVSTFYDDPGGTGLSVGSPNNLVTPISMGFLPTKGTQLKYDILVLEKNTGKVRRISMQKNGILKNYGTISTPDTAPVVLDLAVNNFSERGLLGIAIHPKMKVSGGKVYLNFTERTEAVPGFTGTESITNPKFVRNTPNSDTSDDTSATIVTGPEVPLLGDDTTSFTNAIVGPQTPLLGNRVARFNWSPNANGGIGALSFDMNIIRLRSFQNDRNQRVQAVTTDPVVWNRGFNGNHNSGKIKFGPDGKLYIMLGDQGRRGLMQNIQSPLGIDRNGNLTGKDDVFGGPAPDNAHLTGVILRLNDDGTTPKDNPLYKSANTEAANIKTTYGLSDATANEVKENLKKIFSYGHRNGFGLTFDPYSGRLWDSENSGKAFEEINQVTPGFNGMWVQIMGPSSRMDANPLNASLGDPFLGEALGIFAGLPAHAYTSLSPSVVLGALIPFPALGDFKAIETLFGVGRTGSASTGGAPAPTNSTSGPRGMQQPRFLASPHPLFPNSAVIADSRAEALARLYLPIGAHRVEPQFSVKFAVPNAGLGFIKGMKLGREYRGNLISGSGVARQNLNIVDNTLSVTGTSTLPTNGYENTPYFYPWLVSNAFTRPEDANSTSNFGHLYRFKLNASKDSRRDDDNDRTHLVFDDPALFDKVADNRGVDDWRGEQGSLLFGLNFGVTTEIVTAPDGNLFVIALNRLLSGTGQGAGNQSATGRIYMITNIKPAGGDDEDDGDHDHHD